MLFFSSGLGCGLSLLISLVATVVLAWSSAGSDSFAGALRNGGNGLSALPVWRALSTLTGA